MRITAVDVVPYALEFARPYVTSRGSLSRREMVLVRMRTDAGLEGLGEAVPLTLRETSSLADAVRELREASGELIGLDLSEPDEEGASPLATSLSPPSAAAIEIARLDLAGKLLDQPLWKLLGASECLPVECNATLSSAGPAQVAEAAERWAALGFTSFKLKVGTLGDVAQVEGVRSALGPEARIRIDAHGAWSAGPSRASRPWSGTGSSSSSSPSRPSTGSPPCVRAPRCRSPPTRASPTPTTRSER